MKNQKFIAERDRRLKIIKDKGLYPILKERVDNTGKTITLKTVQDTFKAESYEELTYSKLKVWMMSKELIAEVEKEQQEYSN